LLARVSRIIGATRAMPANPLNDDTP